MERIIKTGITWDAQGLPLENYLAGRFTYRSLAEWRERIRAAEITVNGKAVPPEYVLALHDVVEYRPGDLEEPESELSFDVVYEDGELLVIAKPGNLCMHPSGPYFKHTLWYLLREKYGEVHFINRLDRETSGLVLAARDPKTAARMTKKLDEIEKSYLVMVHGELPESISAKGFLFDDTSSNVRKKRRFAPGERPPAGALKIESARTEIRCLERKAGLSLAAARLKTGRMHQIRATLFSCGFPVVGDKLYGIDENIFLKLRSDAVTEEDRKKLILPCQALHSSLLKFRHPATGEELCFSLPLPESWREPPLPCWETLRIPDGL